MPKTAFINDEILLVAGALKEMRRMPMYWKSQRRVGRMYKIFQPLEEELYELLTGIRMRRCELGEDGAPKREGTAYIFKTKKDEEAAEKEWQEIANEKLELDFGDPLKESDIPDDMQIGGNLQDLLIEKKIVVEAVTEKPSPRPRGRRASAKPRARTKKKTETER